MPRFRVKGQSQGHRVKRYQDQLWLKSTVSMGLHLLDYAILVQSATGMEILVQGLYSQKVVNGGR